MQQGKRKAMEVNIQTTADGSQTLFVPELDEHYHSIKGALTESLHIFIYTGLNVCHAVEPRVLEIGFGTGLNAFLTLVEADKGRKVHFTSLEKYPLPMDIISKMEYAKFVDEQYAPQYNAIHQAPWNVWCDITSLFRLRKMETDLTALPLKEKYDVVYFDAFAPEKQPEMWTQEIIQHIYEHLDEGGIFVTYCAKGSVRRMLQSAGFTVERLAGPPNGKREILRGVKLINNL